MDEDCPCCGVGEEKLKGEVENLKCLGEALAAGAGTSAKTILEGAKKHPGLALLPSYGTCPCRCPERSAVGGGILSADREEKA